MAAEHPGQPGHLGRGCALLLAAGLLTACTTTVVGSGRPAAGAQQSSGSTGSSSSGAPSTGGTAAGGAPLDVWEGVRSNVVTLPAVTVTGTFSGLGFGPSATGLTTIRAEYGQDGDDPLADVTIVSGGATISVKAVGGTAWARATPAFLTAYGYSAADAAKAGNNWAVLTDDDKGIDALASLDGFLQICGPDNSTDDLQAKPQTRGGVDVVELSSEYDDGFVVVDPDRGELLTSEYSGDDLTFAYPDDAVTVSAPPAAQVVTVPDF